MIISCLQCSASCTDFLCGSASCSRLRLSSTGPCPATPRVTWPTTVSSSPTPVSDNCLLPTLEHSLSVGSAAVLETGPLQLQDHNLRLCGLSYGQFRQLLKTFLFEQAMAECELLLTVPNRNILTYLFTPEPSQKWTKETRYLLDQTLIVQCLMLFVTFFLP